MGLSFDLPRPWLDRMAKDFVKTWKMFEGQARSFEEMRVWVVRKRLSPARTRPPCRRVSLFFERMPKS